MDQIWWVVEVSGKYLGKVKATEQEIRAALGPHIEITGNCANVYGPPGEHKLQSTVKAVKKAQRGA